jgi:pimeloyl-ACP methyl ester carboxylesterase
MTSAPLSSSEDQVLDLFRRLDATRLPSGDRRVAKGISADRLAAILKRWRHGFDWRRQEHNIEALPWVDVPVAGTTMRVLYQRAERAEAPTVVLLHGWPDSVLRYRKALPLLRDVHVVVPALPGFPFAGPMPEGEVTAVSVASMVGEVMAALDHPRFTVSAGDLGADIAEHLAVRHPDRVTALHLTNISPLHAVFADRSKFGEQDLQYLDACATWQRTEGGYIAEQASKPATLAVGLSDSPAGLAAWMAEKLDNWSDVAFDDEDLLTWISAYWFGNVIDTSFALYAHPALPPAYVPTPTVLSAFAKDTKVAPRDFAKHFVNVVTYVEHGQGGHFAASECPDAFVNDLRQAIAFGLMATAPSSDPVVPPAGSVRNYPMDEALWIGVEKGPR